MINALTIGLGACIGTLVYSKFISSSHNLEFGRALFVGAFTGFGLWIFQLIKNKKNTSRAA